ncbi:DUF4267 domain-containing protein [Nocardioides sp. IC4_145]|uniref:DUF4267 domain-containing protein n=1 Tax=Nocardioides sp. IC4_145 TaxID=2714037 RepID=UPI001408C256|nr:DUF4267 domain-containing protein [Nocardioides sp. IC4_145]NHC21782.1 DUF4267 domain-containing protein [Nocardioides sp. IC4_145]
MNPVTGLSLGRIAIGVASLANPTMAAQQMMLDPRSNPQVPYVTRLFGTREIALGAATLLATGKARRTLVLLGILVDAADAATGYLAVKDGSAPVKAGQGMTAVASGAVVAGLLGLRTGKTVTD